MVNPPHQRTILYIAGAGRSGSTLVELILGNLPGFFSVGEIRFFWEYMARQEMVCGCGERLGTCPFWAPLALALQEQQGVGLPRMAHIASKLDRTRQALLMHLPLGSSGADRQVLAAAVRQLYTDVFERSDTRVLVDSSKTPTHLRLVRQAGFQDIRILHLIRDGRAVAYSWSKRVKRELAKEDPRARMPSHSPIRSMITWMFENASVARSRRELPYTALRYEDFAAHPRPELARALSALGLPADLGFLDQPRVQITPTHSVGGNPMRFSSQGLQIQLDQEWKQGLSRANYVILSLLGLPMLKSYGYA